MADKMIRTGQTRYALVIGAEVLSRYVDFTDRSTCILFGDGAGAAVMGPAEGDRGVLSTRIYSDGRFAEQLYSPGGGTRIRPTAETLSSGLHYFKMKGNELFKIAVRSMTDVSREVLEEAGYRAQDVKLFIPHQANQRITDSVASKLNVDSSIVYSNIAYHGNTSSASVPIALDECVEQGKVKEGDLVLLASFGGGVTWGGALIKW
jgi:3-oxoacyl-[acyl-carrier-protein] synthase-3